MSSSQHRGVGKQRMMRGIGCVPPSWPRPLLKVGPSQSPPPPPPPPPLAFVGVARNDGRLETTVCAFYRSLWTGNPAWLPERWTFETTVCAFCRNDDGCTKAGRFATCPHLCSRKTSKNTLRVCLSDAAVRGPALQDPSRQGRPPQNYSWAIPTAELSPIQKCRSASFCHDGSQVAANAEIIERLSDATSPSNVLVFANERNPVPG